MKNIQIMNFANDDNEYLNIGHIYYQSKKWLLYSFITVPGMFGGVSLQRILPTDNLEIISEDNYIVAIKKYAKNAKKLGFYDPFGQESLLTDFDLKNLTDETICKMFLNFIKEKEVFVKVTLLAKGKMDLENYNEGKILEVFDEAFTIWDIDTDVVKFDEKYEREYGDVYMIDGVTLALNQMQAVIRQESE